MDQVDYDKLLGNATDRRDDMAAGPDTTMYDEILQKDDEQQNEQLMNSLFAVGGINPDQAAEAQKLGLELGVGPDIARRNMEELRRRSALMKAQEYKLTATSPILARQLTDPEFAAIAQDDLGPLTGTEKLFNWFASIPQDVSEQWQAGNLEYSLGVLGNRARSGTASPEDYKQIADINSQLKKLSNESTFLGSASRIVGQMANTLPAALEYGVATGAGFAGVTAAAGQAGPQIALPEEIITVPAAFISGLSVGTTYMVAKQAYEQEAGSSYLDMVQGGVDHTTASWAAGGVGLVNAALETVGTHVVAAPFKRMLNRAIADKVTEALVRPTMSKVVTGAISTYGKSILGEAGTEAAQEFVSFMGEDIARLISPEELQTKSATPEGRQELADRITGVFLKTAMGMAVLGIPGASFEFSGEFAKAKQAERSKKFFEDLVRVGNDSALRERSPASYEKFISSVAKDGPAENIYVDAEAMASVLNQTNITPAELDQMAPGLSQQIAQSAQTGGDVIIPTAQFAARMAGTDLGNALMPHMRLDVDGVSAFEAQNIESQRAQLIANAAQVMDDKRESDKAFVQSANEVRTTLFEQIKATGIYTPEQARNAATLQAATYTMLADQLKMTPSEVYALMPYKQVAGQAQGETLSQGDAASYNEPAIQIDGQLFKASDFFPNWPKGNRPAGGNGMSIADEQALDDVNLGEGMPDDPFWGHTELLKIAYKRFGEDRVRQQIEQDPENGFGFVNAQGEFRNLKNNRGTFDPNDPNILRQADVPADEALPPGEPVPPEAVTTASLESANALSKSKIWQTGRDLKVALQNAILGIVNGRNLLEQTAANREFLIQVGVKDALAALEQNANAIGWYDLKTRQALAVMSLVHPELATDEVSRFAFTWALAVTSNGIKVGKNFELAEMVYSRWKASDKDPAKRVMPTDIKAGKAQGPINTALQTFNELSQAWGLTPLRLFMLSNFKAGDIKAMTGIMPTGEWAKTDVRGASIIGPKIGNGFFSNLYGKFDALTMDRWLVRTWGRWTGTLIEIDQENVDKSRARLGEALKTLDKEALATALRAVTKTKKNKKTGEETVTEIKPGDRDRLIEALNGDDLDAIADAVLRASQEPKFRKAMNDTAGGEELRKAGNSLAKYLDGQKEQPAGPGERVYIREIFGEMLNQLREDPRFADLTMSDLQAVLWYAEKRLYETAKEDVTAEDIAQLEGDEVLGYDDSDAPDYANAAAAVARAKGVSDRRVKAALAKEENRGRPGSAQPGDGEAGPGAGGQAGQGQQGQARGFTEGERREFVQRRALDIVRTNRGSDAKPSWSYSRGSGEDGARPRVLKKLGKDVTSVAQWSPGKDLKRVFGKADINTPTFFELDSGNAENAARFVSAITDARGTLGPIGEAVHVYPVEDYANLRLFLTDDGKSGFALKPDGDIVSVFSAKGTGNGRAIMETAIAAGGRKLDCFHTILPEFYSAHGFRGTGRLLWNEEVASADMPNWDKKAMGKFNNGEPDVVFMVYDPAYRGTYDREATKLFKGKNDYGRALAEQGRAMANVASAGNSSGTLNQGPRGGYSPKQLTTLLNQSSDVSTVMHEFSHFYLDILTRLTSNPAATPRMKADLQALVEFGGATMDQWMGWTAEYEATGVIPEGMRKVHEAVAYSTEIYLFEGKAPSVELQSVFERFVRWMRQVYSNIREQLNAAYRQEFGEDLPVLTGEVRQVFDRMLASEDQIKQAEAVRNMAPIFGTQADSGMTDEEWAAYQAMLDEARDAAVTDLTKASLRQMQWLSNARGRILKDMQRKHEARRKEVRDEVKKEVSERPVYRAIEFLKRGKIDGEEVEYPVKLSIAEIEAMYGESPIVGAIKKALGFGKFGMLGTENAIHPDQVAEIFGFKSGDAMVRELLAAPSLREAINAETDARMLAEGGDMNTPEAKEKAIEAALHNEARARFVAVELRFLEKATQPVRVMLKAAQQVARDVISRKVIKEIRPREFAIAEGRAAKKAIEAMKAGNSKDAAKAKQAQLLQNQLAAEAIAARQEVSDALTSFRNLFKADSKLAKGRNVDLVNAARAILAAYGIGKADKPPVEYVQQIRAYNPELYAELEPLILKASASAKPYDTLTMDEFRLMRDAVDALWYQARRDNQIMVEGRKLALETVMGELNTRLGEIGIPAEVPGEREAVGKKDKLVRSFFQGKAILRRVEHWASATDGPGGTGPFTRFIWRPMRKAIDAYRTERNVYVKRYVELLQQVDLPVGKIEAPELGYTFGNANGGIGKAELLGAIMHTGNESNLRKLLLGRGWARELEDGTLDTTRWDAFRLRMIAENKLTKADYDFVQAVWDLNEELKPQAQRAHHDLFGYYFKEVKATPITTPFGAYRGGYVPAKTDPDMVRDAQVHQKMEDMESDFRNSMPSTGMGFTKGRVEYNKPLSLDVRLIAKHIDDVIRFSHVQPVVKDVLRILRQREFADNLTRIDPTVIEGMLLPWLNRAARQVTTEAGKHKAVDKFWSAVRSRTGIGIMFANITNALQQVTGYFPALLKVKPTYLKSALVQYMGGLQKMTEEVAELSPFMADRLENQVFDLQDTMNDLLLNPSRYNKVQKWAAHHGYFLQQAFQNQVDVVTWTATFNQTLAELGADKTDAEAVREAVARADGNVRMTQSSLMPEDISAFEVGSPFYKTLIQFSGYFNMLANLNSDEYVKVFRDLGWRGNKGKLAMIYMLGFGLPMLVSDAIVRSLGGGWDDDDDDGYLDVFMSWFFGSQARGAVALIPAFGPGIASIGNAFNNKPYDDRMTTSPSISTLEAVTIGVAQTAINIVDPEKDVTGKNVRDVLTLVSLVTGIPVTVLGRPIGYQVDVSRGKIEPTSAVDYARGLLTGKASPSSRP